MSRFLNYGCAVSLLAAGLSGCDQSAADASGGQTPAVAQPDIADEYLSDKQAQLLLDQVEAFNRREALGLTPEEHPRPSSRAFTDASVAPASARAEELEKSLVAQSIEPVEEVSERDQKLRQQYEARIRSARTMVWSVRSQAEVYQLQHNGQYPLFDRVGWSQFLHHTDADGHVTVDSSGFGPYLRKSPVNPFNKSDRVVRVGTPLRGAGWAWDPVNNQFYCIIPEKLATRLGVFHVPGKSEFMTY